MYATKVIEKSVLVCCDITSGGGVYIYTKTLMELLSQFGVKFYLLTHEAVNEADRARLATLSKYISGYKCVKNGLASRPIFNEIVAYLDEVKPDFFMPNYREEPHAAIVFAKKIGCKVAFVAHNDHYDQYKFAIRYQDNIDYFISPSKKCHEVLLKLLDSPNKHRIYMIPHYIKAPDVAAKIESVSEQINLLYNGRIVFEQKQLYYLPKICAELQKRQINFHLNLVGEGSAKAALVAQFNEEGISEQHYTFHGYVAHERLEQYFLQNNAAILVSSYEGFCLGLAEAMSYGLPAVAFTCGGVIDDYLIHEHNGFLVKQGDIGGFVDRVQDLVSDAGLYSAFCHNSRSVIMEKFNKQLVTKGYTDLLSDNGPPVGLKWPSFRPILLTGQQNVFSRLIEKTGCIIFGWHWLPKIY